MLNNLDFVFRSLWLVGLSTIIAALGYANWQHTERKQPLARLLDTRPYQVNILLSLILISLSLFWGTNVSWVRLVWSGFIVYFGLQIWLLWRDHRSGKDLRR